MLLVLHTPPQRGSSSSASLQTWSSAFPQVDEAKDEEQQDLLQQLTLSQAAAERPWAGRAGLPLCVGVPADVLFGEDGDQHALEAQRACRVTPYVAASFLPEQAPPMPQVCIAFRHSLSQLATNLSRYPQQQFSTSPAGCNCSPKKV